MVRAGVSQHMLDMTLSPGDYTELDTPTGVTALRRAVKDTLYTMANSAQLNGAVPGAKVYYKMSPWRMGVVALDVVIGLGTLWGILSMVLRAKDEKKNPDRYKKSRKAKCQKEQAWKRKPDMKGALIDPNKKRALIGLK